MPTKPLGSSEHTDKPAVSPEPLNLNCPYCGNRLDTFAGAFLDYPGTCEDCGSIFQIRFELWPHEVENGN